MTREEAIKRIDVLKSRCERLGEKGLREWKMDAEACDLVLTALRPVSRERVEKMRGEWVHTHSTDNFWTEVWKCSYCGFEDDNGDCFDFCPECGRAMTDEAVDMMLKRLRVLTNDN